MHGVACGIGAGLEVRQRSIPKLWCAEVGGGSRDRKLCERGPRHAEQAWPETLSTSSAALVLAVAVWWRPRGALVAVAPCFPQQGASRKTGYRVPLGIASGLETWPKWSLFF